LKQWIEPPAAHLVKGRKILHRDDAAAPQAAKTAPQAAKTAPQAAAKGAPSKNQLRHSRRAPPQAAAKKIVSWVVVGGMILIFLFDIATNFLCNALERRYPIAQANAAALGDGGSRIHFLNTGNSDCILLESQGHFAMIDSGWGSDNPIAYARRPGYEARVLAYLKRVAANGGKATLDFIMPTHYHYDHAGGFPAVLADPAVAVKRVYLRPLQGQRLFRHEHQWGLQATRQRIAAAAAARGFPVVTKFPDKPFRLGAMTLQFLNLNGYRNPALKGENDSSVVTLVSVNGGTALLTGDITATHGLEKDIARQAASLLRAATGKRARLSLLKIPHHGYSLSCSIQFLRKLRPKMAVVTNGLGKIYPNVKWNLALAAWAPTYSTVRENGLIVTFLPHGKLSLSANLNLGKLANIVAN
jgi:beta-lactamase superfamily II metal-dependent hydrolase